MIILKILRLTSESFFLILGSIKFYLFIYKWINKI